MLMSIGVLDFGVPNFLGSPVVVVLGVPGEVSLVFINGFVFTVLYPNSLSPNN